MRLTTATSLAPGKLCEVYLIASGTVCRCHHNNQLTSPWFHRDSDLVKAFCNISVPLASLSPGPLMDLLSSFAVSSDRQMSPAVARKLIAAASSSALKLPASSAAKLLIYSLGEEATVVLTDADVHGLVVPLIDGSSRPLAPREQAQPLYLGDQDDQQLFECLAGCLVDTRSLTEACRSRSVFCCCAVLHVKGITGCLLMGQFGPVVVTGSVSAAGSNLWPQINVSTCSTLMWKQLPATCCQRSCHHSRLTKSSGSLHLVLLIPQSSGSGCFGGSLK